MRVSGCLNHSSSASGGAGADANINKQTNTDETKCAAQACVYISNGSQREECLGTISDVHVIVWKIFIPTARENF